MYIYNIVDFSEETDLYFIKWTFWYVMLGHFCKLFNNTLKGSVQQKLRWVKNGGNRCVGVTDCGTRHSFVVLFGFNLGFAVFPFPISTAHIIGEFWKNRWSGAKWHSANRMALYSCLSYYYWRCMAFGANRRSGGTLAAPIGEAGRIRSANMKFCRIFLCSLRFAY